MSTATRVLPGVRHRGAATCLIVLSLGLGSAGVAAGTWRALAGVHAPSPTPDPRLVIVPRTTAVQARLSDGTLLSGTLSPTIPGSNRLSLTIQDRAGIIVRGGQLRLVATMPGMGMPPAVAVLAPHGDRYLGMLSLPMFGRYHATVAVAAPGGRYTGTLGIVLLPPAIALAR